MKAIIILGAAAMLASCMKNPDTSQREEAALMETSREWSQAAQSRDLDKVMEYFADDAVMLSAGQPPLRGKQAIRSSLEGAYEIPGFSISWEPIEAEVLGNMGYLLERSRMTMTGPDGAPVTQMLQAVTVWRKSDSGPWQNVVDITTAAPHDPTG